MEKINQRNGMSHQGVLSCIKGVHETTAIAEVAQMLSSGNWIALYATTGETPTFVMGRLLANPNS